MVVYDVIKGSGQYIILSKRSIWEVRYLIIIAIYFGFLVGGTVEHICSFMQEKIVGTISWDYSYLKYNVLNIWTIYYNNYEI